MYIDGSVYPDVENPPKELLSKEAKADYVHRICSAWDFHIHPEPETFALFSTWKEVFDEFPITTSPAYHAFRAWFGWEPLPRPTGVAHAEPLYLTLDRLEERKEDPCERWV
jgi:hypothetical protein